MADETLRNRLLDFKNSPAAALTPEEFAQLADKTNDFAVTETGAALVADGLAATLPPSYVRNRAAE
ncbi:MAG: hypothetical protein ACK4ZJ_19375, partial [Allorhizobium sp.]